MANVAGITNSWNAPNYVGELYIMGEKKTPFLNMIGGLSGGKQAKAFEFPISQEVALEDGAQPAVTETASLTAPTPNTFVRSQDVNTCQIFHKAVNVSYVKSSQADLLSGLALAGENAEVTDELDFQININMKQLAKDVDYTFINGVYQRATAANVAPKTRGILAAIETNVVDHGGTPAALSKDKFNALIRAMAQNGAAFANPVVFCNALQKQRLSALFESAFRSDSRTVAGVAIDTILTDFAEVGVVWAPHMPADQLAVIDVAYCAPVFLPVPGKGFLFYEALAKTGASESGQIYGQIGLDHGPEVYHGKLTELTIV
jgi:hypothetical protein